jgi:cytochrome b pre-mRNA-processing protein 3
MIFSRKKDVDHIYQSLVNQSRSVDLFADYGLQDCWENRFESICLHGFLVMQRLKSLDPSLKMTHALYKQLCQDLDGNMRHMGVGDLGVARRMKGLMGGFRARALAYESALSKQDKASLVDLLSRCFMHKMDAPTLKKFAHYVAYQNHALMSWQCLSEPPWGQALTESHCQTVSA